MFQWFKNLFVAKPIPQTAGHVVCIKCKVRWEFADKRCLYCGGELLYGYWAHRRYQLVPYPFVGEPSK